MIYANRYFLTIITSTTIIITINNIAHRTLNRILATIVLDWKNIDMDFNAPASNATLSDYLSKFIVGFHAITATVYGAAVYIIDFINDEISEESTRTLIIKMDLPFNSDKRFVYEIVMFSQYLHLLLCSCLDGTLNALLIALVRFGILKELLNYYFHCKNIACQYFQNKNIIILNC